MEMIEITVCQIHVAGASIRMPALMAYDDVCHPQGCLAELLVCQDYGLFDVYLALSQAI